MVLSDAPVNPCDTDPWICSALLAGLRTPANAAEMRRLEELRTPRWNSIYGHRVDLLMIRAKPADSADRKWLATFYKMDLEKRIMDVPWGRPGNSLMLPGLDSRRRTRSESPSPDGHHKRIRTTGLTHTQHSYLQQLRASGVVPTARLQQYINAFEATEPPDEPSDWFKRKTQRRRGAVSTSVSVHEMFGRARPFNFRNVAPDPPRNGTPNPPTRTRRAESEGGVPEDRPGSISSLPVRSLIDMLDPMFSHPQARR